MGEKKEALEAAKENATERLLSSVTTAYSAIGTAGGIVTLLGYVLGAVGLGLGLVDGILLAVVAGLLTIVVLLGAWSVLYRQEVESEAEDLERELREKKEEAEERVEELERQLEEKEETEERVEELERKLQEAGNDGIDHTFLGYAYSVFMHENAVSQDKHHLYTYQKWTFDLTGDDLEYRTVLQGKVWDTSGSDAINIKLFGEVESDVDEMGFAAYQREPLEPGQDETELGPEVVGSSKTTEAVIRIPFEDEHSPVQHKEPFEVCYEVESLGDEARNHDEVIRHVPAHRFQINGDVTIHVRTGGKVEDIEATMAEVSENKLFRSPGEIVAEDVDLTPIPGVDEEGGIEYDKRENRYEYTCEDCHKALFLFRIRY